MQDLRPTLAHLRVITDVLCLAKSDSRTMSNAKYIGRVGGLAVALGVGMAIATTPGVAWADDTGSASSADTTGPAGATGTVGTAASPCSATRRLVAPSEPGTTTGATTGATDTSTVGDSQTDGAAAPGSGAVDAFTSAPRRRRTRRCGRCRRGWCWSPVDSSRKSSRQTPARRLDPARTRRGLDGDAARGAGHREGAGERPAGRRGQAAAAVG